MQSSAVRGSMDTPELGTVSGSGARLAVSSFVSASHPTESCGVNGLPLTPHRWSTIMEYYLPITIILCAVSPSWARASCC